MKRKTPGGIDRLGLILAEMEFLGRLFAQRIVQELLVTFGAKVVAEVLVNWRRAFRFRQAFFLVPEKLTDGFHVIVVEIRVAQAVGVVGREDLDFNHKTMVDCRHDLLVAVVARDVEHNQKTLPLPCLQSQRQLGAGLSQ
jgi:hypothetical protein